MKIQIVQQDNQKQLIQIQVCIILVRLLAKIKRYFDWLNYYLIENILIFIDRRYHFYEIDDFDYKLKIDVFRSKDCLQLQRLRIRKGFFKSKDSELDSVQEFLL
ncbi:unnamed protein product [Paramecium sonneborni]|uniref:Uncharacterized protein n=1 Tax=Paramecium sonneborni TaxID=65129 RepID=A0A8S1MZP7_9CILI|nr:unnamed protein product [Paramecium sonneborni]